MKCRTKGLLIGVGALGVLTASFVLGARFGIEQYHTSVTLFDSASTAHWTVVSLGLLRENEHDQAIRLLEAGLDSAIIEIGVAQERGPSYLRLIPGYWQFEIANEYPLLRQVARYRQQYTSVLRDDMVQETDSNSLHELIAETLKPYE